MTEILKNSKGYHFIVNCVIWHIENLISTFSDLSFLGGYLCFWCYVQETVVKSSVMISYMLSSKILIILAHIWSILR